MGGLRKFVDKIKPTFSEGGKLSFLASTFDAFETFLFVPNTTTSRGAHIRDCNDMKRTMIVVVVALMPALLFGMYNTGYQVGMTGWAAFWDKQHSNLSPVTFVPPIPPHPNVYILPADTRRKRTI